MINQYDKSIFAKNLRARLDDRQMTAVDLARHLDVSKAIVSEWLSGRKMPRMDKVSRIATLFGVQISDLIESKGEPAPQPSGPQLVPVLGSVPAGIPISAVQEILDWEEISEDMARRGEYFALRIRGTSMEPRFREGDVIIVRQQETVENGEIAVVMVNGEDATVKRFFRSDAGITLTGTNPAFSPLTYTPDQVETLPVRIIGKVVELRAKF